MYDHVGNFVAVRLPVRLRDIEPARFEVGATQGEEREGSRVGTTEQRREKG